MTRIKISAAILFAVLFACEGVFAASGESFRFTVTADQRNHHAAFGEVCRAINDVVGGPGAFHISAGDIDGTVAENRAIIDEYFGASAIWFPVVGNHETDTGIDIEWVRNEYDNGNNQRTPLKNYTNQDGPAGAMQTTYSWDYGNAHFIAINEYWDGGTNAGSDTGARGEIVPALYEWLEADLASCDKPFIFVIGHEPAFPQHRHVGSSLDKNKARTDAFWNLLEAEGVTAYICGHTHFYSAHQGNANLSGKVWQFDVGNAGNDPGDGKTFFDAAVDGNTATLSVYRDGITGTFVRTNRFELKARTSVRHFDPSKYTPQEPVIVSINVRPDVSTEVYAVEDAPPTGWTVETINGNGMWDDVNGMVRWGLFYDNLQRTLSYGAIPPEGIVGSQYFSGTIFADAAQIDSRRSIRSVTPEEEYQFGTFDDYKNFRLAVTDNNGTEITFNLTGGGWGELVDRTPGGIILHDTTAKSVFSIRTKGPQETYVGDIIVEGPMRGINAKTSVLNGRIEIGPSPNPKSGVMIAFDKGEGLTINSAIPIRALTSANLAGCSINAPSIGKLAVKESIESSQIISARDVGSIKTGLMADSNCFAGVAQDIFGLPDPAADINYVNPATIKSFKINGIKGKPFCVINSNIAAAQILSAFLAYPANDNNNIPFGLSAGFIKSLKVKDANGTKSWKNLDKPSDAPQLAGDMQILIN